MYDSVNSNSADMFSEAYSMADFRGRVVCDRELPVLVDKTALAQVLKELCHARDDELVLGLSLDDINELLYVFTC